MRNENSAAKARPKLAVWHPLTNARNVTTCNSRSEEERNRGTTQHVIGRKENQ